MQITLTDSNKTAEGIYTVKGNKKEVQKCCQKFYIYVNKYQLEKNDTGLQILFQQNLIKVWICTSRKTLCYVDNISKYANVYFLHSRIKLNLLRYSYVRKSEDTI